MTDASTKSSDKASVFRLERPSILIKQTTKATKKYVYTNPLAQLFESATLSLVGSTFLKDVAQRIVHNIKKLKI